MKMKMKKRDGDNNQGSTECKRPKYDSDSNRDRLSELPECVISTKILSLLPIEEAVKTGVLSTKWKNLWKNMDKIVHLLDSNCSSKKGRKFISFVDRTLMQCVFPKTFSLCTRSLHKVNHKSLREFLDKWLQRVYSQKVENLKVHIRRFRYTPPQWFYHNPNLVKLYINRWSFTIPGPVVSWTSLKSLSLNRMTIGDEEFSKMLSGCPMLENLDLYNVSFNSLNIMSRRIVKLSVTCDYLVLYDGFIEINAPWLQVLHLIDWFGGLVIRLVNVSSLVHANLCFHNHDNMRLDVATKVLESVHHVQELTIGQYFIPALSLMKMSEEPCRVFFKCKRLTFMLPIWKYELPGITYILKNSHHLETLAVEVRAYYEMEIQFEIKRWCRFEPAKYLSLESGDFPHLKTFEVTYCYCEKNPWWLDGEEELFTFEFVAHILLKAPRLEKLVIALKEELCKCSTNCVREGASMLSRKLMQFFMDGGGVSEWKLRRRNKSCFEIIFK